MELLGQIGERQTFYCHVRSEPDWFDQINFTNWLAFTLADEEDKDLLSALVIHCLDKGACYTCSTGQLASLTEDYFDDAIVDREIKRAEIAGEPEDYEATPMTTFHRNFSEGFWFATTVARQIINDVYLESNQVICIDCTRQGTRNHLLILIDQINEGWLPSNEEIESPLYDEHPKS